MRKVNVMMALLITGYILGVWSFLVVPKYYMVFGLKGFLISLVPAVVALFLAYNEAQSTKKTRYLIYELLFKVARVPAVIFTLLMFLLVILGVTAYASGWGLVYLFGGNTDLIVPFAILTILLAALLLMLAKGRTLEFISGISVLMILFTIVSTLLIRSKAMSVVTSEQAKYYMNQAVSSITSFSQPLTFEGVIMLLASVIVAFGLGAGVYYVLGSFAPEDLDFRRVLIGVFFLQIVLSFAAAYTMAYSLGPAFQAFEKSVHNPNLSVEETYKMYSQFRALQAYATNSTTPLPQSIKVFYFIPQIIKGNVPGASAITLLLVLSFYFAGLTTIIVLLEMGTQMLSEVMQLGRTKGLAGVSIVGILISIVMTLGSAKTMFFAVPFSVGAIIALIEAYPVLKSDLASKKGIVSISMAFLAFVGISTLYYAFKSSSDAVKLGAVLGLVLLVPLLMNGVLLKSRR
ncbi:Putative membrane protein, conserved [Thermococcus nautili]|uniref:sodium-dependent transporter n=1 Tax=Thermococcus nautili TaxID=195522 RepID=UPI00255670A0|nr:sodium-dependent transporter [Thermococcus nautili]CAI1494058.1 Putative membrane protein, conserved [Thermococcus nautili]